MPSISSLSQKERSLSAVLLKRAMLLALLLHLFGMVAVPNYAVRIIERESEIDIEVLDLPIEYPVPEPKKEIEHPWIPDLDEEEDADVPEDRTIEPTVLDGSEPIPDVVPILSLPDPGVFIPRDTNPEIIRMQSPSYPSIAQAAGIEGEVWVHMYVDVDGRVKDVRIRSGHEVFHESVREAAYRILFDPATFNNRKVAVWVAMKFDFIFED